MFTLNDPSSAVMNSFEKSCVGAEPLPLLPAAYTCTLAPTSGALPAHDLAGERQPREISCRRIIRRRRCRRFYVRATADHKETCSEKTSEALVCAERR